MSKEFKVLLLYPNAMLSYLAPPAISIFSAILKERGFKVDLFDTTFYRTQGKSGDEIRMETLQVRPFDMSTHGIRPKETHLYDDLKLKVEAFSPDLIALSVLEDSYPLGLSMLKSIRTYYKCPIIVGGVFATWAADKIIKEDCVDIVCRGDGEPPLVELCERMRNDKDSTDIKGLWVKKDGALITNPIAAATDINSLPVPDFSIFEEQRLYRPMTGKIYRMLPVETHRGCPYQCTYCNSPALEKLFRGENVGSYFRKKNIEKIYEEIRFLVKRWDVEYIYFTADTFLAMSIEEFKEFCEMYKDIKLPFWIQTRPETLSEERVELLEQIGCHRISIGIEHGNEEFRRKVIKRNISNKDLVEFIKLLEGSKTSVSINNIIGFPGETRELAFDTVMLNREVKSDTVSAHAFVPYHGTPLREICLKKGYISEDSQTLCVTISSILNMPQFTRDEIEGLRRTFVLYAKMPESEFPKIKIAERFDEEGNKVFAELSKLYRERYFGTQEE